ncbi:MAG: ATP-binding protein [Treponema sp.]|jgi:predicted AAA+ superfamily ATPase|nr:ATP-binding protein [Treponema sp.]
MIQRPEYLNQLLAFKDRSLVKIVTGVRRCGKSTMLELYRAELAKRGVLPEQMQSINLEDLENEPLKDYKGLYDYISARLVKDRENYVFLDEAQVVPGFGKVVNSLFLKKNVDIYLTGSNSKMQSKDIANQIEREYVTIHMLPLSFKEYFSAYPFPASPDAAYNSYLRYGSFPRVMGFMAESPVEKAYGADQDDSPEKGGIGANPQSGNFLDAKRLQPLVKTYLSDLYDKIVLKDIVESKGISNTGRLESMIRFMADHIGSETSINNISRTMTADGRKIDIHMVENFIDAFRDSFILYKADRYDVKGKKMLKTLGKYYLVDIGLRYLMLGDKPDDSGHILENVVYLELLRRGYQVYVGKVGEKEVDFVAEGANGTEYYQVSETVRGAETLARELAPLDAIRDHNPKILLTRDYDPPSSHNGIKQLNVLDWLLG